LETRSGTVISQTGFLQEIQTKQLQVLVHGYNNEELDVTKLSAVQSPVTGTEFSRFPHTSQLPQRKKKEAKRKESCYYCQVFSSHYRALNTYKGKRSAALRRARSSQSRKTRGPLATCALE